MSGSLFEVARDAEHTGPRCEWYCACQVTGGAGNRLNAYLIDYCDDCKTLAPWLTWKKRDDG